MCLVIWLVGSISSLIILNDPTLACAPEVSSVNVISHEELTADDVAGSVKPPNTMSSVAAPFESNVTVYGVSKQLPEYENVPVPPAVNSDSDTWIVIVSLLV